MPFTISRFPMYLLKCNVRVQRIFLTSCHIGIFLQKYSTVLHLYRTAIHFYIRYSASALLLLAVNGFLLLQKYSHQRNQPAFDNVKPRTESELSYKFGKKKNELHACLTMQMAQATTILFPSEIFLNKIHHKTTRQGGEA